MAYAKKTPPRLEANIFFRLDGFWARDAARVAAESCDLRQHSPVNVPYRQTIADESLVFPGELLPHHHLGKSSSRGRMKSPPNSMPIISARCKLFARRAAARQSLFNFPIGRHSDLTRFTSQIYARDSLPRQSEAPVCAACPQPEESLGSVNCLLYENEIPEHSRLCATRSQ